jgi:Uma2 family endonuclease
MGMPALNERRWTRAEVLALPDDGQRYELVDGELLVSPAPRLRHQHVVQVLFRQIDPYVIRHRLGDTFGLPGDLTLNSGQVVQPDLFVVSDVLDPRTATWDEVGVPFLAVEVLSPSTARHDRIVKRMAYQRAGVATYWIVDTDSRLVELWTPDADRPVIITDELVWQPDPAVAPLRIALDTLLGPV